MGPVSAFGVGFQGPCSYNLGMDFETLRLDRSQPEVVRVTLTRPQVRNAFNSTMIAELTRVFASLKKDKLARVVVLSGEGPTFCAGGDLNWMRQSVEWSVAQNLKDTVKLAQLFDAINTCAKPVVAAVHGAAIGGGVGLVSVCDIVVATASTEFSLSEVRLGIIPACIGPFVISKIGASHARALFVGAERFKAQKAYEIGLIHDVVADEAALKVRVNERVQKLLECGPAAMQAAKQLVLDLGWPERRAKIKNPLTHVAKALAKIRVSPEGQEGVRAFLEKRAPKWLKK